MLSLVGTNGAPADASPKTAPATPSTSRTLHRISAAVNAIKLVYINTVYATTGKDGPGLNAFTIKAALELMGPNGPNAQDQPIVPVTFAGASSINVAPGAIVESDLITITVPAGAVLFVRGLATPVSGTSLPSGGLLQGGTSDLGLDLGEGFATGDLVTSGIIPNASNVDCVRPFAILGQTIDGKIAPSVAIVGDSIGAGTGDGGAFSSYGGAGFLVRACYGQDVFQLNPFAATVPIGYVQLSRGGEQVAQWVDYVNNTIKPKLSLYATDVWSYLWGNDTGLGFASIKANLITLANWHTSRGQTFRTATHNPGNTSTDGWRTIANQTPTNVSIVGQVHAFLRDTGPNGFISLCQTPSKVFVSDLAASVSVDSSGNPTPDSTYWPPASAVALSGSSVATTNGYVQVTGPLVRQAWRGYTLYITSGTGAGTLGPIQWNNTTTLVANGISVDATSNFEVRQGSTDDGGHPDASMHQIMARAFNKSMLTQATADPYQSDNATPVQILADYKPSAPNPLVATGLGTVLLPTAVLTCPAQTDLNGGRLVFLRRLPNSNAAFVIVGMTTGIDANTPPTPTFTDTTVSNGVRYEYTAYALPIGDF